MAETLTGWHFDEANGMNLSDVFHITDTETKISIKNAIEKVIKSGETTGLANHSELWSKTGEKIQIAYKAASIKGDDENYKRCSIGI